MPYQPYPTYTPYQTQATQPFGSYFQQQPQPQQLQPPQQPVNGFVYVTGLDGAKAYLLPPNSQMPLFDDKDDVLYIKTTDGAGFPTIRVVDCIGREQQSQATTDEVAELRSEVASLREAINGIVSASATPSA